MLIDFERKTGRSFMTWQSIQSAVTDHVPAENWEGAYNIVPVPAAELRRKLLAMTSSGGKDDRAARCLNLIDKLRDEYGAPESEPPHPAFSSSQEARRAGNDCARTRTPRWTPPPQPTHHPPHHPPP